MAEQGAASAATGAMGPGLHGAVGPGARPGIRQGMAQQGQGSARADPSSQSPGTDPQRIAISRAMT
jgi:hypothetical protein